MLRLGVGKPKIQFHRESNDMSHVFPAEFKCGYWFWMSLDKYVTVKEFEGFVPEIELKDEFKDFEGFSDDLQKKLDCVDINSGLDLFQNPGLSRLKWLLKQSGGHQCWEMNVIPPKFEGYIRIVAVLGEKRIHRWSWFDAMIKLPFHQFVCSLLNRARVPWLWEKL